MTDLSKLRHARSKKDFPGITLEEDEYVELSLRCSRIIPIFIWSGTALALIVCGVVLGLFLASASGGATKLDSAAKAMMTLVVVLVMVAIFVCALVATRVYNANRIYITNNRVVQQTMTSLFSASTNIIDLNSIEDVSFKQNGLFEHLFNIGTLRMSTVGDETTYTFKSLDNPVNELKVITHLVHEAKDQKKDKEDN
ncbi:MAG: PH domain-containing protein [Candidatus Saccharibacteria bacterium]|nr:PH domain-containing protein [Candidatus Saccharibacteria bacterium]